MRLLGQSLSPEYRGGALLDPSLKLCKYDPKTYSENSVNANFGESRLCELWLVPTPMGENFSGSSIVTSRNPLIQKGATTATKSPRFGAGGRHQGLLSRG